MNKTRINQYEPDEVSIPGQTLQEILTDRGMTQVDLAGRLGVSTKHINEVIKGNAPISHEIALKLERVLGIRATFWNNLELNYREFTTRREEDSRLAESQQELNQIPWKEAVNQGWISKGETIQDQARFVLSFFGLASFEQYHHYYDQDSARWHKHSTFAGDPHALAVWLRQGEILGAAIDCKPYDKVLFEDRLSGVRDFTSERDPKIFVSLVQTLCASCGVAAVFVPEIGGSRVSGATRWLNASKALIQLSCRSEGNDNLWLTFFHGAGHIVKHGKRTVFIEPYAEKDKEELEADKFASEYLIPREAKNPIGELDKLAQKAYDKHLQGHSIKLPQA